MNKLSYLPQGAVLLCLLLAHQSHSTPSGLTRPGVAPTHTAGGAGEAGEVTAPLVLVPNGTPGWLSLVGELPTTAPLTADVLGAGTSPVASHTWRGLPGGRVQLALNLRSLPAGAYRLRLSQNGQQWQLPLAVK
ncbi:hypothetical protein QMK33_18445 [Hymenobacter sp. H14-R3]|uniref:hypothetical protein n=1 Tax=Hymenobacter sp. H14-R3 TaxID=3046308 RepID=UPI0024B8C5D7|nr:hypothetical protein [Hymenobacter sp. H14-R3]MDJ0367135.1 hypothetical protein [Hymenobacter sp. H14-R3]